MKLRYILLAACTLATAGMRSQSIEDVLRQIERNNKELQAQTQATNAAKLEVQTQNNLEDPSVEYSPFYTRPVASRENGSKNLSTASNSPHAAKSCSRPRISALT